RTSCPAGSGICACARHAPIVAARIPMLTQNTRIPPALPVSNSDVDLIPGCRQEITPVQVHYEKPKKIRREPQNAPPIPTHPRRAQRSRIVRSAATELEEHP